jgi:hypothetical protein
MKQSIHPLVLFATLCVFALLSSCVSGGDGQSSTISQEEAPVEKEMVAGVEKVELGSIEEMPKVDKVPVGYKGLQIGNLKSSEQIKTDYPMAAADCKKQILKQLSEKKNYLSVTGDTAKKPKEKGVKISLEILDMRITSSTARMFGGAFVGSSFMDVLITFTDTTSGKIIHKKVLSTSNNAWAASYSGGSSDQSLPSDFGMLIGEYIYTVVPAGK